MKPDGVVTAAMEPMETLDSDPVNEAAPALEQGPNQAASPADEAIPQQPAGETGQVEPQPDQNKETPAAKTSSKSAGDPKTKTTNKATGKTKPATNSSTKAASAPQNRLSNGVSKPQTNGVAKKTPAAAAKKTTTTTAPTKKPLGLSADTASKSKAGEKKSTGATPAANGAKSMTGTTAAKKTTSSTANGVKTSSSTTSAAKKPPANKPAVATSKPSSAASPKPPVSKTTRPSVGTAASSRPSTGSTQPTTASKSSSAAAKPATPKSSTTAKPAASKTTSTTPSGGKPPASQTSRNATPVKKDVTKPATPASKKPGESPLTRPSTAAKSAKPETPKSASKPDVKKPTASKAADTKTPNRPKTQDSKTPSKDASKTPVSKTAAAKTSAKKPVGTTNPTPVRRAPKAATTEKPEKEIAAAVAAAAAIATAAATIVGPEVVEPAPAPELMTSQTEAAERPMPEAVPAPVLEPTPEPTPEPVIELTPEPVREPTPEPIREPTPEPVREPTPEPIREPTPEPIREPTPEPVREPTPEPIREPTPEPAQVASPEPLDPFKFEESTNDSVPSLGTTVMSPPSSPPGPGSPVREPQNVSSLLDMHVQSDMMNFQTEEEKETREQAHEKMEEKDEDEEEEEEKENLFAPSSTAPSSFSMMGQPDLLGAGAMDDFTSRHLMSPHEKEDAVEKADEEINEDDDDEEEEDEDEEQRKLGHQPSSTLTDMSTSQPSEEFQTRSSAFGGSAGWHGDDLLSGMDSEDVSSCTSSRQQGVSDLSSTQHTAILEGTQSSDALIDSSLRGSEGDCNLMGSPNVETLANEEEDEDEQDERVDDMDLSSERVEEHHKAFQQEERDEEEEDEDVEMHSEGVTESCGNADEDDFNEEEHLDNLSRSGPLPCAPPTSSWGQTNLVSDTWTQPASLLSVSSPSPISDHGAVESETPTLSPAQACLDSTAPSLAPRSEDRHDQMAYDGMKTSAPEESRSLFDVPDVGMSQPGALATHSGSETSTPDELRNYDSSSGVESRSDKQQTPVPASVQPDMEQDLGIHLEKGDGEEEEAETLPADEVLGTGPPTAPASAPSSPSTSGDEASDTEGEMQINDPDAPAVVDESARFESPTTCSLPALEEDEEAADPAAGEGEEDGGGTTPQSANSVASYGFDCTTSNSNMHSMAESCGKSPGIFSLENEEQLPEEAKDPSLIKELTLPSAASAAHVEDLLGRHVDLMPLGHPGENQPSLGEQHYMMGGKMAAEHLEEVDPLEPSHHLGAQESEDTSDSQPPYYSTICDKTDSFLAGNV